MTEDSLRLAIDAVTARLRNELEAEFAPIRARHVEELESARRTAEAEAEVRWLAKLDDVRTDWSARLESKISEARVETEHLTQMLAESTRVHAESEKHRDDFRRELEDRRNQIASATKELDSLRAARLRAESALHQERSARAENARQLAQSAEVAAEARVAERQSQLAIVERLLMAIRSLDSAPSLSQVLTTLLSAAAVEAPRVALFVLQGTELKPWKTEGFGMSGILFISDPNSDDLLAEVLRRGEPLATSDIGPSAPGFAQLPPDRAALAVPLLVGAMPVAVLYADDAGDGPPQAPAPWPEAIQILCRHASVNLTQLTAARAPETMRRWLTRISTGAHAETNRPSPVEDSNAARRYARLLVSEIKLYNEAAVRTGREKGDLLSRLKPEIERAYRLYRQRTSSTVDSADALFQHELIVTLAEGDATLLGGPA